VTIDRLYQCDPAGPTSNSNFAGIPLGENAMAPSHVNNAFRQLALMLAHELHLPAAQISASVSCNVVTSSIGLACTILGAGAVNSLGVIPGEHPNSTVLRFLEFSSSASLSHGPALRLIGGASRKTQPGDISGFLHVGSGDSWIELFASRADGALAADSISVTTITNRSMSTSAVSTVTLNAASASVTNIALTGVTSISASVGSFGRFNFAGASNVSLPVQVSFSQTQASVADSTNIPFDASAPLVTEGTQAFSVAFTPKNASSVLIFDISVNLGGTWSTGEEVIAALFKGSTCLATGYMEGLATNGSRIGFSFAESASNTTLRSYTLRFGAGTGDTYLNRGNPTTNNLGGTIVSSFKITEWL
jgi:hypothetical protein